MLIGRLMKLMGAPTLPVAVTASASVAIDVGTKDTDFIVSGASTTLPSVAIYAPETRPGRIIRLFFTGASNSFTTTAWNTATDQTGKVLYHTTASPSTGSSVELIQQQNGGWLIHVVK